MPEGVAGICWPHGGTVGCITVDSKLIYGQFPALHGDDAAVCCQLTPAGKYRNGAARAWCRAHQQYWGVKADLAALAATGGNAAPAKPPTWALCSTRWCSTCASTPA